MRDSDRTVEVLAEDHEITFNVEVTIAAYASELTFEMRCTEIEYVGIQRAAERSQAIAYAELHKVLPTLSVERTP